MCGPGPDVRNLLWSQVADQDKHVTTEHFDATVENVRKHTAATVSAAEARIYRAMLVQTLAILGGLLAILRLVG